MEKEVRKRTPVHDSFPGETATFKHVADGWAWVLSKTFLETGQPLNVRLTNAALPVPR